VLASRKFVLPYCSGSEPSSDAHPKHVGEARSVYWDAGTLFTAILIADGLAKVMEHVGRGHQGRKVAGAHARGEYSPRLLVATDLGLTALDLRASHVRELFAEDSVCAREASHLKVAPHVALHKDGEGQREVSPLRRA